MNIALNPEATAEKSRETYRKTHGQFEAVTLIPREAREFAETSVAQTREAYLSEAQECARSSSGHYG